MADLTVEEIFETHLPERLKGNEKAAKIKAVYQFIIKGDSNEENVWVVDLNKESDQVRKVSKEEDTSADCTLSLKGDDFVKLWIGELNGMKAMMMGKLKIKGNMGLATKLQAFIGK